MRRFEAWDVTLACYLRDRALEPFRWVANDCCTFAADGILAITGTDIAEDFRGRYRSSKGAFAAIRKVTGGSGVEAALHYCAQKYGMVPVRALHEQRGDLLLVEDSGRLIAGLVSSTGQCVCVGDSGLHRLPITSARAAWTY